jgi:MSHA biogenesis protein MshP
MSTTRPEPRRQHGFSIVAAVFILVVLAGLAGYIVSTNSTQNLALAQDAMNSRAHQAARAGLEWGTHQVTRSTATGFRTACDAAAAGFSSTTPATQGIPAGTFVGLDDFRVDLECRSQSFAEGAGSYRVYQLVSTACTAAACPATAATGFTYVEHQQRATVRQ